MPLRRPITFDDLMTHRSGLAYAFSVGQPLARGYGKLMFRQEQDRWLADLATLPLAHQPGDRLTYGHSTDVLGIALSRIEGKPLADVLANRILDPLGMSDTGFKVTHEGRRRTATMYKLDENGVLRDDVMGPAPVTLPTFCTGGAGLWSTADDYLAFVRMLLGGGSVDGVRVLSEESVRLMRTDRLTDQQKTVPFLGMPFWRGRGFGLNLSVVTDPRAVSSAVRSRRYWHLQLARRLRHVVAGRSVGRADPDVPHPEPARPQLRCRGRRGGGQYLIGQTSSGATTFRPPHVPGVGGLTQPEAGSVASSARTTVSMRPNRSITRWLIRLHWRGSSRSAAMTITRSAG